LPFYVFSWTSTGYSSRDREIFCRLGFDRLSFLMKACGSTG
jgi:hypothetical protein